MMKNIVKFGAELMAVVLAFAGATAANATDYTAANQDEFREVAEKAVSGDRILLDKGTFAIGPVDIDGKTLTFKGAGEALTTVYIGNGGYDGNGGHGSNKEAKMTFEELTLDDLASDSGYLTGFTEAAGLTFRKVTFNVGFSNWGNKGGAVSFYDCTFNPVAVSKYNVQELRSRSGTQFLFDGCVFNSAEGRFINAYKQGGTEAFIGIVVKDCTFKNTGIAGKCALNLKDSANGCTIALTFVGENKTEGAFPMLDEDESTKSTKPSKLFQTEGAGHATVMFKATEEDDPVVIYASNRKIAGTWIDPDGYTLPGVATEVEVVVPDVSEEKGITQEIVEQIAANPEVAKVEDTGLKAALAEDETLKDAEAVVKVELTKAAKDETGVLTFEIKPVVKGETETDISDKVVGKPITFRVPLTDAFTKFSKVTHKGTVDEISHVEVLGAEGSRYVELTFNHFSEVEFDPEQTFEGLPEGAVKVADGFYKNGESDFYIISKAGLEAFRDAVNAGDTFASKTVVLGTDIDLSSVASWTPIGTNAHPFSGVFDGQNNTISNLKHTGAESASQVGLFGLVSGVKNADYTGVDSVWANETFSEANIAESKYTAVVKNLVLDGVAIENTSDSGSVRYTGALVGEALNAYIANISVSGSVSGTKGIGGVVGSLDGSVAKNCSNGATVTASSYNAGGIAGGANYCNGDVAACCAFIGCSNAGKVTTTSASGYAGGIVGMPQSGNCVVIADCSNSGEIHSVGASTAIGGISGQGIALKVIVDCENTGALTSETKVGNAGGIAGYATGKVYNCDNMADITISADALAGVYNFDPGQGGTGACVDCTNVGALTNTNPDGQTYPIGGGVTAYVNSGLNFEDVAALNAFIAANVGDATEIQLKNCTVTDPSGTLVLPSSIQSVIFDQPLCAAVDASTGSSKSLAINIPDVAVSATANKENLSVKGANSVVTVADGAMIGFVDVSGNGSKVVNNGTIVSLNLDAAGTSEVENKGTLGKLNFNNTGTYNVVNNGTITHQTADANIHANEHTVDTIVACTATIDNYGRIEAKANASGVCSYALLFYNGANVVVNSYKDSVICADKNGCFIACGSAEAVTLNVEEGAVFKYGDTPFTPVSSGKLTVQPMAKPVARVVGEVTYEKIAKKVEKPSADIYLDMNFWGLVGCEDADGNACPKFLPITDETLYRDTALGDDDPEAWVSAKYVFENYLAIGKDYESYQLSYLYVAHSVDASFATIGEAVASATKNSTITLLANVSDGIVLPYMVTLDKNGFTCGAVTAAEGYAVVTFENGLQRTYMDSWERPDLQDLTWFDPNYYDMPISTPAQFAGFAAIVNGKAVDMATGAAIDTSAVMVGSGVDFEVDLEADIDLRDHSIVPIGFDPYSKNFGDYTERYFAGYLNGNGHKITYSQSEDDAIYDYNALFGALNGAMVSDLTIDVTASYPAGSMVNKFGNNVYGAPAGLASYVEETSIENVTLNGSFLLGGHGTQGAGLVAIASDFSTFVNCTNNTTVNLKQYYCDGNDTRYAYYIVGGIVGQTTCSSNMVCPSVSFVGCVNNSSVISENPYDNDRVNGVETGSGSFAYLAANGSTVAGSRKLNSGGMVGQISGGSPYAYQVLIQDCVDNGNVIGTHIEKINISDRSYNSKVQNGGFIGKQYVGGSSEPVDCTIVLNDPTPSSAQFYANDNIYIVDADRTDYSGCTVQGEGCYYRNSWNSPMKIYQTVGGKQTVVSDQATIDKLIPVKKLAGPVVYGSVIIYQETAESPYWSDHAAAAYSTPVDTDNKVLTIATPEELALFAKEVTSEQNDYNGYTVKIVDDIDLSAYEWVSIKARREGYLPYWYALQNAVIDGGDHTITGMRIANVGDYDCGFGFVGEVMSLRIKDLTFDGASIDLDTERSQVGIVIGALNGAATIENVHVMNCTLKAGWHCGAIIGFTPSNGNTSYIRNCTCEGVVVTDGYSDPTGTIYSGVMVGCVHQTDTVVFEDGTRIKNDCSVTAGKEFIGRKIGGVSLGKQSEVDGWWYPTLADGIAAVEEDGEVDLLANCAEEITTDRTTGFTMKLADGVTFTGKVTGPEGYALKDNGDRTYTYGEAKTYVAEIEGVGKYETLEATIDAASKIAATAENPTVIKLYAGDMVYASTDRALYGYNLAHVVFQGAENHATVFKGPVCFQSGYECKWTDVEFRGILWDGAKIVFSTFATEDLAFDGNVFRNVTDRGDAESNRAGVHFTAKCTNLTYVNNVFDTSSDSSIAAINTAVGCLSGDVTITNNVFKNSNWRSLQLQFASGDGVDDNFLISDNWFVGNNQNVQIKGGGTSGGDTVVANINYNVFDETSDSIYFFNTDSAKTTVALDHNFWSKTPDANPAAFYVKGVEGSADNIASLGVYPYYAAYDKTALEDGTKTVREALYDLVEPPATEVAAVISADGTTTNKFATLQAAVAAANAGETIKMLCDATEGASIDIEKSLTIDLAGTTLTFAQYGNRIGDDALVTFQNGDIAFAKGGTAPTSYKGAFYVRGELMLDTVGIAIENCADYGIDALFHLHASNEGETDARLVTLNLRNSDIKMVGTAEKPSVNDVIQGYTQNGGAAEVRVNLTNTKVKMSYCGYFAQYVAQMKLNNSTVEIDNAQEIVSNNNGLFTLVNASSIAVDTCVSHALTGVKLAVNSGCTVDVKKAGYLGLNTGDGSVFKVGSVVRVSNCCTKSDIESYANKDIAIRANGKLTIEAGADVVCDGVATTVDGASIDIAGGKFKKVKAGGTGTIILTGGVYVERPDDSYAAESYSVQENADPFTKGDYPWAVAEKAFVPAKEKDEDPAPEPIVVDIKPDGQAAQSVPVTLSEAAVNAMVVAGIIEKSGDKPKASEVNAGLAKTQNNQQTVWQNYVMGVDGTDTENVIATIGEKTADKPKDVVVVKTPIRKFNPPQNTGVTVSYRLMKSLDGKAWEVYKEGLAKPEFDVDTSTLELGDTLWKIEAVFSAEKPEGK